ncbi:CinA-like protein, partial [Dissostichus eleginoides]
LGQTAGGAEEKPGHGIYKSVALRLLYQTSMEEQQTPQLKNSGVTAIASLAEAR